MPSRELKNLAATLAQADSGALMPRNWKFSSSESRSNSSGGPSPRPEKARQNSVSFFLWLLSDERRSPELYFALTEHSVCYIHDPAFDQMNFEEWQQFANVHGITGDEFRAAWWRWTSATIN